MRVMLCLLAGAMLVSTPALAEKSWPQFRGFRGDGTSLADEVPIIWNENSNIVWKVTVPGRGRSSPVVVEDRIFVTSAVEQGVVRAYIGSDDMQTAEHVALEAACLDRSRGTVVWRTRLFEVEKPDPVHYYNSWATPTPVVDGQRLYCDFGTHGTVCLDTEQGKVIWKTRLPLDHQVGPGSSPVLWKNLLILVRDGRDAQFVAALDRETGKTVWKTERPPIKASSGNLKKSFVTPLVVSSDRRVQLISPGAHWVVSYDPESGKELWRARHGDGFSIGSCPVFAQGQGLAIFSTGCMKAQLCAIRVDGAGDVSASHFAWKTMKQVPVMSSPVLAGNEIYWVSDEGMVSCADVQTGDIHWQERLNGLHLASPLLAQGRLYVFAQDGRTSVLKAGKQFEKISENKIEGPLVATPAIVDGHLLLRTDSHLYQIGTRQPSASF